VHKSIHRRIALGKQGLSCLHKWIPRLCTAADLELVLFTLCMEATALESGSGGERVSCLKILSGSGCADDGVMDVEEVLP
jgi:hypothetical protein